MKGMATPKKIGPCELVGRPTKYKPQYCQEIVEFFDKPRYKMVQKYTKDGDPYLGKEYEPLPTINKFAHSIDVTHDTILEWAKVHEDFSVSLKKAKALQMEFLMDNGLEGGYQTAFAIFTAKNILGWKDKIDIDATTTIDVGESLKKWLGIEEVKIIDV